MNKHKKAYLPSLPLLERPGWNGHTKKLWCVCRLSQARFRGKTILVRETRDPLFFCATRLSRYTSSVPTRTTRLTLLLFFPSSLTQEEE
jgi:hypothetical protein